MQHMTISLLRAYIIELYNYIYIYIYMHIKLQAIYIEVVLQIYYCTSSTPKLVL